MVATILSQAQKATGMLSRFLILVYREPIGSLTSLYLRPILRMLTKLPSPWITKRTMLTSVTPLAMVAKEIIMPVVSDPSTTSMSLTRLCSSRRSTSLPEDSSISGGCREIPMLMSPITLRSRRSAQRPHRQPLIVGEESRWVVAARFRLHFPCVL
jgi:hypothetical protein